MFRPPPVFFGRRIERLFTIGRWVRSGKDATERQERELSPA